MNIIYIWIYRLHKYNLEPTSLKPILIKFLASPINPSDINQIEGVYPEKPYFNTDLGTYLPSAVAGNEGVVEIIENLDQFSDFKPGKHAIMKNPSFGFNFI